jgi:hypothetical protein
VRRTVDDERATDDDGCTDVDDDDGVDRRDDDDAVDELDERGHDDGSGIVVDDVERVELDE